MNDYLQNISTDKLFNWIQDITPDEYAQLTPVIQLEAVNTETNSHTPIPLTSNSNINGVGSQPYWYTNRTVGLKSMSMDLDGNTNPVGGKIYKITLNLLFDSINTFFDPVSTSPPLPSYARFLQSQAPAGSPDVNYSLKLSVFYDGPSEIKAKYGLDLPNAAFSTYLSLIKSELQIKENLQAECKCVFQGWQESLFQNNQLFDWLRLDLDAAAAELRTKITSARDQSRSDVERITTEHNENMQ